MAAFTKLCEYSRGCQVTNTTTSTILYGEAHKHNKFHFISYKEHLLIMNKRYARTPNNNVTAFDVFLGNDLSAGQLIDDTTITATLEQATV